MNRIKHHFKLLLDCMKITPSSDRPIEPILFISSVFQLDCELMAQISVGRHNIEISAVIINMSARPQTHTVIKASQSLRVECQNA
jgi:hypothetical protein